MRISAVFAETEKRIVSSDRAQNLGSGFEGWPFGVWG